MAFVGTLHIAGREFADVGNLRNSSFIFLLRTVMGHGHVLIQFHKRQLRFGNMCDQLRPFRVQLSAVEQNELLSRFDDIALAHQNNFDLAANF